MATKEPACVGKGGVVQFNCLCSAILVFNLTKNDPECKNTNIFLTDNYKLYYNYSKIVFI